MKVALLAGVLSSASGGLAASVPGMARALEANAEVEPHVLGLLDPYDAEASGQWGGHVHAHRHWGPARFQWAPDLATTVERIDPDVIDTQGLWMNLSRVALARHRRRDTALVVTPRGMLDPWALRQSALRKRLAAALFENKHLATARAVRALNEDEARAIRRFSASARIVIVPNGIEPPDAARVRPMEDRQRVIQFVGRLDPKKGLEPLFRAWAIVRREPSADGWQLRVNGWGASHYRASLKSLASDLGLGETLRLGGPIFGEDKDAAFADAAGFVLPSYSEGLPMAVLEAWSWGTPALITRACNLPEGFETGAAAEVATEPYALARGILDFIERSADERRTMSRAARSLVDTRFHAREVAHGLERLYAWTVGGGEAPAGLIFE
ncbi:MAG: glycosyltransferase [Hyphomonas sp.]|nr:glycosyltransferase [Hyphomonas sp.]